MTKTGLTINVVILIDFVDIVNQTKSSQTKIPVWKIHIHSVSFSIVELFGTAQIYPQKFLVCILSDHVFDKLMHTPAFRVPVSKDSSFSRSCF